MIAIFRDGTTGPVTDMHWSPAFTVGLAHRPDGYVRAVFFDRGGLHRDPWVLRLVEAPKPKIELVA